MSFKTIELIEAGRTGVPRRATKRVLATAVGLEPEDIWPAEVAA